MQSNENNEKTRSEVDALIARLEARARYGDEDVNAAANALAAERDRADRAEARLAEVWDSGFDRGFYDSLAGGSRDASESSAVNPYRYEATA